MAGVEEVGFIMSWLVPSLRTGTHSSSASRVLLLRTIRILASLPWPVKINSFPGKGVEGVY